MAKTRRRKEALTDVLGVSGVGRGLADDTPGSHHGHNHVVAAARQEVCDGEVVSTAIWNALADFDMVAVVPADGDGTRTLLVGIRTPDDVDRVWSVSPDDHGRRGKRLCQKTFGFRPLELQDTERTILKKNTFWPTFFFIRHGICTCLSGGGIIPYKGPGDSGRANGKDVDGVVSAAVQRGDDGLVVRSSYVMEAAGVSLSV